MANSMNNYESNEYLVTLRTKQAALLAEIEGGKVSTKENAKESLERLIEKDDDINNKELLQCELRDLNSRSISQLRQTCKCQDIEIHDYEAKLKKQRQQLADLRELTEGLNEVHDENNRDDDNLILGDADLKNDEAAVTTLNMSLSNQILNIVHKRFKGIDKSFWEQFVKMPKTLEIQQEELSDEGIQWLLSSGICKQVDEHDIEVTNRIKLELNY